MQTPITDHFTEESAAFKTNSPGPSSEHSPKGDTGTQSSPSDMGLSTSDSVGSSSQQGTVPVTTNAPTTASPFTPPWQMLMDPFGLATGHNPFLQSIRLQQQAMWQALAQPSQQPSHQPSGGPSPTTLGLPTASSSQQPQVSAAAGSSDTLSTVDDSTTNPLDPIQSLLEDISSESEEEGDEALQDLMNYFGQEENLGPDLDSKVKHMADLGLRMDASRIRDKEEAQKILRPANCEALAPPKVNPDIWSIMSTRTKSHDLAITRIQGLLLKGIIPVLRALEDARSRKDKDNTHRLADSFRMLAMANSLSSQLRKEGISWDLNKAFRPLCSPRQPVSTLLFGDSLAKDVKDIRDRHATGDRLSLGNFKARHAKSRHSAKPYSRQTKKPFLGQKTSTNRRKWTSTTQGKPQGKKPGQ